MSETTLHTRADRDEPLSDFSLWLALAIPPGVWALHGLVSAVGILALCARLEPTLARATYIGASLIALIASVAATLFAYRLWSRLRAAVDPPSRLTRSTGQRRQEFLAMSGVLVGVIFSLAILWGSLPLLIASICEGST
jgi:hypothetical protein